MESIFSVLQYIVFGFFGVIALLIVFALLFGKRVQKKWESVAVFRDAKGRKFGKFDIEMSRVEKEEPEYSLKTEFHMRHESLGHYQTLQVFLDDLLVLEGLVTEAGQIRLGKDHLQSEVSDSPEGKTCRVVCGGEELFAQEMLPD